ncbi:3-phosphoshikimate 1-carboxyvinyltransferase [Blastopirellula retiformator]|uniref:3-phosphoshikimate 1-carboxyvinyltransferase n=1 Tax=Blastopirellula retiformator TaxID=2527970 RepID=A0A5C5UX59_9BACT|nr:3-phosphoshikimate 1-carboxyvinyltransferase [Blastopirellula retiformator]TWT29965.1 3-phosphoshikimate 1-carboxyvinyltransferase [Blastopirellula retiformator]
MTSRIEISPAPPILGSILPPGSKSLTNRALVIAALAEGDSVLTGALESEDTHVMIDSLRQLGIEVQHDSHAKVIRVAGTGGAIPAREADLFVANSGTTIRFLTAMVATGDGKYRLDGIPRMRERPIKDLLDTLSRLGVTCRSETGNGCPPVVVETTGLVGGAAKIAGDISSQYLSGLMMAAPYAASGVTLEVVGELVSKPYVQMTAAIMSDFGVTVDAGDLTKLVIPPGKYQGREYAIEPDASAASYFWGAAAITGGSVTVEGLSREALQGDVAFCECLEQMGCQVEYGENSIKVIGSRVHGICIDMNAISDTVQTLAAVALFADGPTTVTGVAHNRHKETDRIGDLARELRKLGAIVEELEDGLTIIPGKLQGAEIETYNDHRMAMSLALVGLRQPGVVILNPTCTNKTYPHYFADLARLAGVNFQ